MDATPRNGMHLWTDPQERQRELEKMRTTNAEWDFMGRSFLVWALANRSLRHPQDKPAYLEVMDRIIDETLRTERELGMFHFLMPYARQRPFVMQPPRSIFLDGEIALMLAMRRLVEEKDSYRKPLRQRVQEMVRRMEASPVLCAESYPDECWMFCNTVALAAIRTSDRLDGTDHRAFFQKWLEMAKQKLVDPRTGLLVSSFTLDGQPQKGPNGSSLWLSAHCLQLIDEDFAADQYRRAKRNSAASCWVSPMPASGRSLGMDSATWTPAPWSPCWASAPGPADWRSWGRGPSTMVPIFAGCEPRWISPPSPASGKAG